MSLQSIFRDGFTFVQDAVGDQSVTVISNGQTAEGVKAVNFSETGDSEFGEEGLTTNLVRVSAADMSEPKKGATIIVDGDRAMVTRVRTDPVGALRVIEYQDVREIEDA